MLEIQDSSMTDSYAVDVDMYGEEWPELRTIDAEMLEDVIEPQEITMNGPDEVEPEVVDEELHEGDGSFYDEALLSQSSPHATAELSGSSESTERVYSSASRDITRGNHSMKMGGSHLSLTSTQGFLETEGGRSRDVTILKQDAEASGRVVEPTSTLSAQTSEIIDQLAANELSAQDVAWDVSPAVEDLSVQISKDFEKAIGQQENTTGQETEEQKDEGQDDEVEDDEGEDDEGEDDGVEDDEVEDAKAEDDKAENNNEEDENRREVLQNAEESEAGEQRNAYPSLSHKIMPLPTDILEVQVASEQEEVLEPVIFSEEDVEPPPSIRITFSAANLVVYLFKHPSLEIINSGDSAETDPPVLFQENTSLYRGPLCDLFEAVRHHENFAPHVGTAELIFDFSDLGLTTGEDNKYLAEISAAELDILHSAQGLEGPLNIECSINQSRFIARFREMMNQVHLDVAASEASEHSGTFNEAHEDDSVTRRSDREQATSPIPNTSVDHQEVPVDLETDESLDDRSKETERVTPKLPTTKGNSHDDLRDPSGAHSHAGIDGEDHLLDTSSASLEPLFPLEAKRLVSAVTSHSHPSESEISSPGALGQSSRASSTAHVKTDGQKLTLSLHATTPAAEDFQNASTHGRSQNSNNQAGSDLHLELQEHGDLRNKRSFGEVEPGPEAASNLLHESSQSGSEEKRPRTR